jgi:hypothetical protein
VARRKLTQARLPDRNRTNNLELLQCFLDMGVNCALYEGWRIKNAPNCASIITASAKRFGLPVRALSRSGKVYLLRLDAEEVGE